MSLSLPDTYVGRSGSRSGVAMTLCPWKQEASTSIGSWPVGWRAHSQLLAGGMSWIKIKLILAKSKVHIFTHELQH